MKLSKKLILFLAGFTISVFVLLFSLYLTYSTEETLQNQFNEWEQDHFIIENTKTIVNTLFKTENNVRAYIITKDTVYLKDIQNHINSLLLLSNELVRISQNDSIINKSIISMCVLANKKFDNLNQKINYSNIKDNVLLFKKLNEGTAIMDEVRTLEEKIINIKVIELNNSRNETQITLFSSRIIISIVATATICMLIFIFLFFNQYFKSRSIEEKELKELNDNKNKFFSIISHDLRNPVKNIALMSELMLTNTENKSYDSVKLAQMISGSANNLSSLLDNLLKWSRIQMNNIEINLEEIDIHKISIDVIRHQANNALNKKIEIYNFIQNNTFAFADQNMITTVLRNLLSNAIKFTEKGGKIEFYSIVKNSFIEISITDNGIGMPQEIADKIFSIDFKHSTKGTNKEEGTGLGLKICKEFIDKNKGNISVISGFKKGTTFNITLPVLPKS